MARYIEETFETDFDAVWGSIRGGMAKSTMENGNRTVEMDAVRTRGETDVVYVANGKKGI
jgi:hypothetical protein